MHVVIMGCGRVGSALALRLIELGHSVAIIDKDETAFLALGDDFTGQKVLGVGFDRDTLIEAGIEKAQAFCRCFFRRQFKHCFGTCCQRKL